MSWMTGHRVERCPTTGLTSEARRKYVAMLRKSLRRAVIDQNGLDAIQQLIPELSPNGTEPVFEE